MVLQYIFDLLMNVNDTCLALVAMIFSPYDVLLFSPRPSEHIFFLGNLSQHELHAKPHKFQAVAILPLQHLLFAGLPVTSELT